MVPAGGHSTLPLLLQAAFVIVGGPLWTLLFRSPSFSVPTGHSELARWAEPFDSLLPDPAPLGPAQRPCSAKLALEGIFLNKGAAPPEKGFPPRKAGSQLLPSFTKAQLSVPLHQYS